MYFTLFAAGISVAIAVFGSCLVANRRAGRRLADGCSASLQETRRARQLGAISMVASSGWIVGLVLWVTLGGGAAVFFWASVLLPLAAVMTGAIGLRHSRRSGVVSEIPASIGLAVGTGEMVIVVVFIAMLAGSVSAATG